MNYQRILLFLILMYLIGISGVMAQDEDTLRVGIIPFKTSAQVIEIFTPLFEYVGKQIELPVKVSLVNEEDLGYMLANNQFDIGVFTPFPYLRAKEDFPGLELSLSHIIHGEEYYTGAILTHSDSEIRNISDLKGRNMLFVKPTSTSGFLFPKGILKEYNIDLEEGDLQYDFSGSHDLSLAALLRKETDAIAIDMNSVQDMLPDPGEYRIIQTYSIPYHAYVFSPQLAGTTIKKIMEKMIPANKNPEIRYAFNNELGLEQWVARNDSYYNSLRRMLQFARIKPAIRPRIDTKPSARASFAKTGDLLDVLLDNIINELKESGRFIVTTIDNQNNFHELKLDISMIQEFYQCQIYLDDRRIEYFTDVDLSKLQQEIPKAITQAVLSEFLIETELLQGDSTWFITYGTDDGINNSDYEFVIVDEKGSEELIPASGVMEIAEGRTYFKYDIGVNTSGVVNVRYAGETFKTNLTSSMPEKESRALKNFWDDKDNQWGIIGLVVTLIGVIIGGYFTRKKQKRFRSMLLESNQLLLEYIKGQYKLENEVIAHKEKINQFLEKGYITENQYLILKHRIEDIHNIIQQILREPEGLDNDVIKEVKEIIKDGVITEKEYSRLVALVQQSKTS